MQNQIKSNRESEGDREGIGGVRTTRKDSEKGCRQLACGCNVARDGNGNGDDMVRFESLRASKRQQFKPEKNTNVRETPKPSLAYSSSKKKGRWCGVGVCATAAIFEHFSVEGHGAKHKTVGQLPSAVPSCSSWGNIAIPAGGSTIAGFLF